MTKTVTLGHYLFTRLRQLGVGSVHGVPGDYFLRALDLLKPAGLRWIGSCNELNAGYAADGYARVKGVSALMTTYGVGELSALNAVAGSFAEYAPVVSMFPAWISFSNTSYFIWRGMNYFLINKISKQIPRFTSLDVQQESTIATTLWSTTA